MTNHSLVESMTPEEKEQVMEQRIKVRLMQQELLKREAEFKQLEQEFEKEHKEIKTMAR